MRPSQIEAIERRRRTWRAGLITIIVITIPFYCVGIFLWGTAPQQNQTVRTTPTALPGQPTVTPITLPTTTPIGLASITPLPITPLFPTQVVPTVSIPTAVIPTRFLSPTPTFVIPTPFPTAAPPTQAPIPTDFTPLPFDP